MKWYIIHAYSGFEAQGEGIARVAVQAFGLQDKIASAHPRRVGHRSRGGKKYTPKHVLSRLRTVKWDMDDHYWHVVKATRAVTGFVGTGQQPTPLSDE